MSSSNQNKIEVSFKELQELDRACMQHDPLYLQNNPNTVLIAAKLSVLRMSDRIAELENKLTKLKMTKESK